MSISDGFAGRDLEFGWGGSAPAGVREKGLTLNGEPIDVTSDDASGWRTLLTSATQKQADVSISGVTFSHALKNDWLARTSRTATFTYPDGTVISFTGIISEYSETGNYQDATTFEATIMSSGAVTIT